MDLQMDFLSFSSPIPLNFGSKDDLWASGRGGGGAQINCTLQAQILDPQAPFGFLGLGGMGSWQCMPSCFIPFYCMKNLPQNCLNGFRLPPPPTLFGQSPNISSYFS